MKIKELLYKLDVVNIIGSVDVDILDIQFDSRLVKPGGMFVAIKGRENDGHCYIEEVIIQGVKVIIVEEFPEKVDIGITYIKVKNSTIALGVIASNFYHHPSEKIKLIGVTGTNGKTTTVSLLNQLLGILGIKSGMLSTINNQILNKVIPSTHTTPDALQINYLLDKMIKKGCEYCFMEVSSHAITQSRIIGLNFTGGVFTNITREHLDYHKNFSEYIDVKKSFFNSLSSVAFALVNSDDKNGMKMVENTSAKKSTYSLRSDSDYKFKILENQFNGMLLSINKIDVWVKLIGEFNAYNMLSVYATAHLLGFSDEQILPALSLLEVVEGRFECVRSKDNIIGIVDYAHTDDALKNVLQTIKSISYNTSNIITVVGCGGNRDKEKRPLIASVACNFSTHVILTTDNPRTEDANSITQDMLNGLDLSQKKKALVVLDRKQAIKTASRLAKEKDIILIAGKGHEKHQEINGKKIPFNDLKELKKELNIN